MEKYNFLFRRNKNMLSEGFSLALLGNSKKIFILPLNDVKINNSGLLLL